MNYLSAEPRCSNAILKKDIDVQHLANLTEKQLDRLPRELCARPLLPVYDNAEQVIGHYCAHCDGPLHRNIRGPEVLAAYMERRRTWTWPDKI